MSAVYDPEQPFLPETQAFYQNGNLLDPATPDVYVANARDSGAYVLIRVLRCPVEQADKPDAFLTRTRRELLALRSVTHSNLLQLHNAYFDETHLQFDIVMEYEYGATLGSWITQNGPLSESQARVVARQLCDLGNCLHESLFLFRDLSPSKIMVTDEATMSIKLLGLGQTRPFKPEPSKPRSRRLQPEMSKCIGAEPEFVAPEIFRDGTYYGPAADSYSVGHIVFHMLLGRPAHSDLGRATELMGLTNAVRARDPLAHQRIDENCISANAADFINALAGRAPAMRTLLQQALTHPWLLEHEPLPPMREALWVVRADTPQGNWEMDKGSSEPPSPTEFSSCLSETPRATTESEWSCAPSLAHSPSSSSTSGRTATLRALRSEGTEPDLSSPASSVSLSTAVPRGSLERSHIIVAADAPLFKWALMPWAEALSDPPYRHEFGLDWLALPGSRAAGIMTKGKKLEGASTYGSMSSIFGEPDGEETTYGT